MTHPTFSCRNTLQRLRETHDLNLKQQESFSHKTVQVTYTVIYTKEDGTTSSIKKQRTLCGLASYKTTEIEQTLKREFSSIDQAEILSTMNMNHDKQDRGSFKLTIINLSRLEPTGDDDQM